MHLMIDSGAYTAFTRGEEIDVDEYIEFCHKLLEHFPHAVIVNLDVIGDGAASYRNWRIIRKAGLDPLPVYHVVTEVKWLHKYLDRTDHVGIGAIANMITSKRRISLDRIWRDHLVDRQGMPIAKVHGMGITGFELMRRYPWHSVDSTSFMHIAVYGHIYLPQRRKGRWDYSQGPIKIAFTKQSSDRKNRWKHISTLSPPERKMLLKYIHDHGFVIGEAKASDKRRKRRSNYPFGKPRKNKPTDLEVEEIVEPGVSNTYHHRAYLNAEFYSQFLREHPWPRPLAVRRTLFDEVGGDGRKPAQCETKHTILYFGGATLPVEQYLLGVDGDRHDHVGILLSYIDLRQRGTTRRRLMALSEHEGDLE